MDRQQIGLKLTIDALELPFALERFSDRLVLQKAICLAQAAGVELGYNFHWYIRGPYSPPLTRDAFAIADELKRGVDESKGWQFDGKSTESLSKLKQLIHSYSRDAMPRMLEVLGSICFLMNRQFASPKNIREALRKFGKCFSDDEINEAVRQLTHYGLIPAESR